MAVLGYRVVDGNRAILRLRRALLAASVLGLGSQIWAVNLRPVLDTWSDRDRGVVVVEYRVD